MTDSICPIVVLGSSGIVARQVIPLLAEAGYTGHVISREQPKLPVGFNAIQSSALLNDQFRIAPGTCVVGLWPLWMIAQSMERFAGAGQLVALGSTSVFSKVRSADPAERDLSESLAAAEARIREQAAALGLSYTILRPTIIYDCETDRSVNAIADVIKRFGFFAIAGKGAGLRQPIHACDVATAVLRSIGNTGVSNRSLDLTGGDTLTYRTMVERIANGLNRKPRIAAVPTFALKSLVYLMRALRLTRHSPSFIDRMNEDLAFDGSEARALLGFEPRGFRPVFDRQVS